MKILSIDVGIKNLALCLIEGNNKEYTIKDWKVINLCGEKQICSQITNKGQCKNTAKFINGGATTCKRCLNKKNVVVSECIPIKNINAKDISLIDIGVAIKERLEKYYDDFDLSTVSKVLIENQISPIANRMKTIQGMIAQFFIMKNLTADNIEFISATNKLKSFIGSKKTPYKERKTLSISVTLELIKKELYWHNFFKKHNKKDDLADCFLQGLWYLKNKINK